MGSQQSLLPTEIATISGIMLTLYDFQLSVAQDADCQRIMGVAGWDWKNQRYIY
jgi:hypothetical protein